MSSPLLIPPWTPPELFVFVRILPSRISNGSLCCEPASAQRQSVQEETNHVFEIRIRAVCNGSADHHVILPTESKLIRVEKGERETTATFGDRRWVFPNEDCILLSVANTTAELLGKCFAERLLHELANLCQPSPYQLTVRVEENFGQWAGCTIHPLPLE